MKSKLSSYLLMIGLLFQFVVVVSSATPTFIGANSIDFDNQPSMIQEVDFSSLSNIAGYATYGGYWTDLINTEKVSNDGSNVYVAVLDTGLLSNWASIFPDANIRTDLGKGYSHDISFDPSYGLSIGPLRDDRGFITDLASGHGTHVTSTIVGFDIFGLYGVNGIAPKVNIIPVLVLDAWEVSLLDGSVAQFSGGTNEMISAGITYIADLKASLDGPVVINMSLGGGYSSMIEAAIDYAIAKGVIIVVSAGNEAYEGMGYPGALPQVISAASVGWTGTWAYGWTADTPENLYETDFLGNNHQLYLSDFSSRPNAKLGQKNSDLDVAAPGSWIVGPYKSAFVDNFSYYYLSGTSMAAPHVTGMIALILQSYPSLTQYEVEFIVKNAAHGNPLPADGTYDLFYTGEIIFHNWNGGDYGAGFLTADQALNSAAIHA